MAFRAFLYQGRGLAASHFLQLWAATMDVNQDVASAPPLKQFAVTFLAMMKYARGRLRCTGL